MSVDRRPGRDDTRHRGPARRTVLEVSTPPIAPPHDHDLAPRTGLGDRRAAVRRAALLNRITIGYNAVEGVVAITAGVVAGSVSLVGFGLDSAVEVSASVVLAWRLHRERRGTCMTADDQHAVRLIALCFAALAVWVGYEGVTQLLAREVPGASPVGMALAGVSVVAMPALARAKKRLAPALGSQAVLSEAKQTEVCAWLSGILLAGLAFNAVLGWWWADPLAALGIAGLAGYEAVRTWRAESLEDTCCG